MPKPIKDARSPYWQYDFQRNKRRFHGSTGCTSERKAQAYINRLLDEIAEGKFAKPQITLDLASESFWQESGQHDKAAKTTEYQIANLCTLIGKGKLLSDITIKDFRDFVAKRRALVSNSSVNRELEVARRIWNHASAVYTVSAINWGELRLEEPKERIRELTAKEETALFENLPDSLKPIVEFAILSGQRRSAITGLRWDKIDWGNGEATIINKGGANHTFPLSRAMIQLILEQPQVDGCDFVFTYLCERPSPKRKDRPQRRKGHRYPFSEQGWTRKWRKALEEAGITDFRFHDLRHTSATRIMRATGNIKAAGKLLGHSDIRTTSRYAHVGMDDLRGLMAETESRNSTGKRLTDTDEDGTIPPESEA